MVNYALGLNCAYEMNGLLHLRDHQFLYALNLSFSKNAVVHLVVQLSVRLLIR